MGRRYGRVVCVAALLAALTPARFGTGQPLDSAGSWPQYYVKWECGLLAALGFGLDLGRCVVTGATEDLAYVSPRSGRAGWGDGA